MAPRLRLQLLGPPLITLDGEALTNLKSRTAEALLIYLIFEKRPLSRQFLADFFWDERDAQQASANLRAVLSMLRKALGDYVEVTRQTVAFNGEGDVWLDTAVLEQHLASSETQFDSENQYSEIEMRALQTAVNLYRGEFLEGFYLNESRGFEEWMILTRERLGRLAVNGFRSLTAACLNAGQYRLGQKHAGRWLALDPFDESAHRQMMWLLAREGQRSAALKQYKTCSRILEAEIGVDPAPATTELYERLLNLTYPPPHNLPAEGAPFVGRQSELDLLFDWVSSPHQRLISILGPGGMGKTRLALEAARRVAARRSGQFLDGVFFVSLSVLPGADFLTSSVADALGVPFQGSEPPDKQLLAYLQTREMLLVLDNFEHLVNAASLAWLQNILTQAPHVTLLVTSRARLGLSQERVLDLQGLEYDRSNCGGLVETAVCSAVKLFLVHAQRVRPAFNPSDQDEDAILELCSLVKGLPLGIELAATWVRLLSCREIVQRVQANMDLLAENEAGINGNGNGRSMRATFDYSWQALNAEEQRALRRLAVFHGPFQAQAAESIAGLALVLLSKLVDRSMLQAVGENFFTIHPLLHQYCTQKLAQDPAEAREFAGRHAFYYTQFLHKHAADLATARQAGQNPSQELALIRSEIDNVRGVWQWMQTNQSYFAETAVDPNQASIDRFVDDYGLFLAYESWYQESVNLYATALERLSPNQLTQGRWQRQLATAYLGLGDSAAAEAHFKASLAVLNQAMPESEAGFRVALMSQLGQQAIYRLWQPRRSAQNARRESILEATRVFDTLSRVYYYNGQRAAFAFCALRALNLAEKIQELPVMARNYANLSIGMAFIRRHAWAEYYYRQAHAIAAEVEDVPTRAYTLLVSGAYDGMIGAWDRSQHALDEAVVIYDRLGDRQQWGEGVALLCTNLYAQGRFEEALGRWQTLYAKAQNSGNRLHMSWALTGQAGTLLAMGQIGKAENALRQAEKRMADLHSIQNNMSIYGFRAVAHLRRARWLEALADADAVLRLKDQTAATFTTIVAAFEGVSDVYLTLMEQPEDVLNRIGVERSDLQLKADEATATLMQYARGVTAGKPKAYLNRGKFAWQLGQKRQAHQHWQEALAAAQKLYMPYDEGCVYVEIARHLPPEDAIRVDYLHKAVKIFKILSAGYDLEKAQRLIGLPKKEKREAHEYAPRFTQ